MVDKIGERSLNHFNGRYLNTVNGDNLQIPQIEAQEIQRQ